MYVFEASAGGTAARSEGESVRKLPTMGEIREWWYHAACYGAGIFILRFCQANTRQELSG
jgi:hypothetical protein